MTNARDEDRLEGDYGRRKAKGARGGALFPDVSVSGAGKRARAAWFTRPTGAGRVKLASLRPPGSQRVIIKARVVVQAKAAGKGGGAGGLMRHALYVEREGAGRDGDAVKVFDREVDEADGAGFVGRCEGDRHHFRIIIAPEHGGEFENLRDYTRDLMGQVETDLGCRLDWIAAEHHDTGRPHVHLLIRGKRPDARDLVIPREYVSHTFRHRAEAIATRELGPRRDQGLSPELDRRAERAAKLERPTHLDAALRERARGGELRIADLPDEGRARGPLLQRLNKLEEWGLARREAPDLWRLDSQLEHKLDRLGEARDRERATARLMAREDRGLEPTRTRELEQAHSSQRVTGRLIGFEPIGGDVRGPFLIGVEGIDGKLWTARVARMDELRSLNGVERGAVVELTRAQPGLKPADRTILDIAGEDGVYSPDRHRQMIPSDSEKYIQTHVRRLEALRMDGIVERDAGGAFYLPHDYEARVLRREAMGGRESARVTLLDPKPLEKQVAHHGPSWVDGLFDGRVDASQVAHDGFGKEAREAWIGREHTLKELGLGREAGEQLFLSPDWRAQLKAMEREDLRQRIERDTGRVPHFARDGERVEGVFVSRIHTQERSYALILQERTATLAPWRPEMDRALNQFVSGRVNGRDFDFNYGKGVEKEITRSLGLDLGR